MVQFMKKKSLLLATVVGALTFSSKAADEGGQLGEAVDCPSLTWTTGGNAAWGAQTATTHDGLDAARSGKVSAGQSTWMQTTVSGPCTVSFWWKVSSESNYDVLRFFVNGLARTAISGEGVDWSQRTVVVTGKGEHTLMWQYSKDGSVDRGDDCGWVDQVAVTPGIPDVLPDGYNYTEKVGDYMWAFSIADGEVEIGVRDANGNTQGQCAVGPDPVGELIVPATLGGFKVTKLGYCALYNCDNMTSAKLPTSLREIGYEAFYSCDGISSVEIPASVEAIGDGAFRNCSNLRNLSVSSENAWFSSDDGVLYDKGKTDLYFWPREKHIDLPTTLRNVRPYACCGNYVSQNEALTFPAAVTNIGYGAFYECQLRGVALNEGLVSIGNCAFQGNNQLRYVVVPSTLESLESGVFYNCQKLSSVYFKGNAPTDVSCYLYDGTPSDLITFVRPGSTGWQTADSSTLPEAWPAKDTWNNGYPRTIRAWTTYPDVAFLVRFDLGAGATRIGGGDLEQMIYEGGAAVEPLLSLRPGYEFYQWSDDFSCVSNSMVVSAFYRQNGKLPDGYNYTEEVDDYTWTFSIIDGEAEIGVRDEYGNPQWQRAVEPAPTGTLTVPDTLGGCAVTRLGYAALCNCDNMTSVELPQALREIGNYAFDDCDGLSSVELPNLLREIGSSAFCWCYRLEAIEIPASVEAIGDGAFSYCSSLRNLSVSSDNAWFSSDDGVLYDKGQTDLYFWPREKHIDLPSTLRNVRSHACRDNYATQNETLVFPASVTNIGYSAFASCSLGGISLNEGLISIDSEAFRYNYQLRYVVMPSTLGLLNSSVFCNCEKLSSVYFRGNAPAEVSCYLYDGTPVDLITFVRPGSTGWQTDGSSTLPEAWPAKDAWNNGTPRTIRTWTTYPDVAFLVRFDLGAGATRIGGGDLEQMIYDGGAAVAPLLSLRPGYEFYQWSDDFSCVSNNMVVSAIYRQNGKLPDGYNYTEQVDGYTWTFSIVNGEAEIGVRDDYGNPQWECAVTPEPTGTLTVPDTLGGCPVTRLGYCALVYGGMTGLVLPQTLNAIGDYAIYNCGQLTDIDIPAQVRSIGDSAFAACWNLQAVTVDEDNVWFVSDDGVLYDKGKTDLYFWPREKRIDLPSTVRNVRPYACRGNYVSQNEALTFPAAVTNIGYGAFYECQLRGVALNEGLVSIGNCAFQGNNQLRYVVVPSTLESLESGVFYNCQKLSSVYFKGNAPTDVSCGLYYGTSSDLVTFVRPGSTGWQSAGSSVLPETWPANENNVCNDWTPRTIRTWTTYPNICWPVTFDLRERGVRIGGGELVQDVSDGAAAVAPVIQVVSGAKFDGWSCDFSCVTSALTVVAKYVDAKGDPLPAYYVDAAQGDDGNDGTTASAPFATIQHALDLAVDGDIIEVGDGTYAPIVYWRDKAITVRSANGAARTMIDGGGASRCVSLNSTVNLWGSPEGKTVVVRGFTLCNGHADYEGGGAYGGTFVNCIISNCVVQSTGNAYGGGVRCATLTNCLVVGNCCVGESSASGGGAYDCDAYNCTIVNNRAESTQDYNGYDGGVSQSRVSNSIVWGNDCSSQWGSKNGNRWNAVATWNGDDSTLGSPRFADAANGDYRLYAKSPCINAGENSYVAEGVDLAGNVRIQDGTVDMGAYEGGVVLPTRTPTGVAASENVPGKIVLTWEEMPCADGYRVYRATSPQFAKAAQVAVVTDGCTYVDDAVSSALTYYYWVRAYNDLGESAVSDGASGQCGDPLKIVTATLTDAKELTEYGPSGNGVRLEATGGCGTYEWSCRGGYVPEGSSAAPFVETGAAMGWCADEGDWWVDLPFDFPVPGVGSIRKVAVMSNGALYFLRECGDGYYEYLEDFSPLDMDLRTDRGGDIYLASTADQVTIRWDACRYGDEGKTYAFAMTLYPDGRIDLHYGPSTDEALSGLEGTVVTYRRWALPDGMYLTNQGLLKGTPILAGEYRVLVVCRDAEHPEESVESVFAFTVRPNANGRPVIDSQTPDETTLTVLAGEPLTLSVAAHDPEGRTLSYQWYVDGEPIEDATGATFVFETDTEDIYSEGVRFTCRVSDDLWTDELAVSCSWRVYFAHEYYPPSQPEALRELCAETEFATGDVVYVEPGSYEPFECYTDVPVRFVATGGADVTFIDGSLDREYYACFAGNDSCRYPQLEGFTLMNGRHGAYGATLVDCVIRDCSGDDYGAASCCNLKGCYLYGNVAYQYGAAYWSTLDQCTVYGNSALTDENPVGGLGYCTVCNSIVVGNGVDLWNEDGEGYYRVTNSCFGASFSGVGNIVADPKFVNAAAGDFRLRTGSPCLEPRKGAYLGAPVAGYVVAAEVVGYGALDRVTAVVAAGGSATFAVAADSPRPIDYFEVGGERLTGVTSVTVPNVTADVAVKAVFKSYTFYVDAASGHDANDGLTAASAKATIQAAVDLALPDEKVLVADGTYEPFAFREGVWNVAVESQNGSASTFVDGGGTNRCVTGCEEDYDRGLGRNVVRGLTLQNGFDFGISMTMQECSPAEVSWVSLTSRGGGASCCRLEDCVVRANRAACGGGLYYCEAERTLIIDNVSEDLFEEYLEAIRATYSSASIYCSPVKGGGAYGCDLRFCTVVGNAAQTQGGGACYGNAADTILWGNAAETGSDAYDVACDRCCFASQVNCWGSDFYSDDPQFADASSGDYRLLESSPYVAGGKAWLGAFETPYGAGSIPTYGPWGESEDVGNPDQLAPTMLKNATLTIYDEPAARGDVVAVFRTDTDTLCGLGKVLNDNATLTIPYYAPKGVRLTFKVWQAASGSDLTAILDCDAKCDLIAGGDVTGHALVVSDTVDLTLTIKRAGWQAVSFNVEPEDATPDAVFAEIADQVDSVVQGVSYWMPGEGGTLSKVKVGKAYWVKTLVDSVSWTVTGKVHPETEISLSVGWNLVGYTLENAVAVEEALKAALAAGVISDVVCGIDFFPDGSLTEMKPGKAYWVNATQAFKFVYGQSAKGMLKGNVPVAKSEKLSGDPIYGPWGDEDDEPANPDQLAPWMLKKMSVSVDGSPAAQGDVVAVFRDDTGALCGFGRALGTDGKVTVATYAPKGTTLSFKLWVAASGMVDPVVLTSADKVTVSGAEGTGLSLAFVTPPPSTTVVSFDANGGAGGPAAVTATKGKAMPAITIAPTWAGHSFLGYFDSKDADAGAKYYNADLTSARNWDKDDETATLYARWSIAVVPPWPNPEGTWENCQVIYARAYDKAANAYFAHTDGWMSAVDSEGVVRGVAQIYFFDDLSDGGMFILDVGFDGAAIENLALKYWDPDVGELTAQSNVTVRTGYDIGGIMNPVDVMFGGDVEIDIQIEQDYSWISLPVMPEDAHPDVLFASCEFAVGDRIKGQGSSAQYSANGWWIPGKFEVKPGQTCVVKKSTAGTAVVTVMGSELDGTASVYSGWNWIGSSRTCDVAIDDIVHSVGFVNRDKISAQAGRGSSSYYDGRWYGSLNVLKPGVGYKLKLSNAGTLTFGSGQPPSVGGDEGGQAGTVGEEPSWARIGNYANAQTIYARLSDMVTQKFLEHANGWLAAFDGDGVIRGKAQIMEGPKGLLFALDVGFNENELSGLVLKYWDPETGEHELGVTVDIGVGEDVGSIDEPFTYSVDMPVAPTLPEALDASQVAWSTDSAKGWFAQTKVTKDGVAAAQSGSIGNAESSALSGTVSGSGKLSFWWKVSSDAGDRLKFAVDGEGLSFISGEQDWKQVEVEVQGEGEHVLSWTYVKNKSVSAGSDCGWLDQVSWTPDVYEPETEVSLAEALDADNVVWSTGGDAGWRGIGNGVTDFARSGEIGDNESSSLSTILVGPGDLSFRWKVSSEEDYDELAFMVDGEGMRWVSGEKDWATVTVSLTAGVHEVGWVYWKDESDSAGSDCAFLDQVVWVSSAADDPIPDLGETPTEAQIREALAGSADASLADNITDGETYAAYRAWAEWVSGGDRAGMQEVKDSPHAWLSFALDASTLIETLPADGDVAIDRFESTVQSGQFEFAVRVGDLKVGSQATAENLKKVFELVGGSSLDDLSADNVDIIFGQPVDGKVTFTAGPKKATLSVFFMKLKMTP